MTTIWVSDGTLSIPLVADQTKELWPKGNYDKREVVDNPMRCIIQDPNKRKTYF